MFTSRSSPRSETSCYYQIGRFVVLFQNRNILVKKPMFPHRENNTGKLRTLKKFSISTEWSTTEFRRVFTTSTFKNSRVVYIGGLHRPIPFLYGFEVPNSVLLQVSHTLFTEYVCLNTHTHKQTQILCGNTKTIVRRERESDRVRERHTVSRLDNTTGI